MLEVSLMKKVIVHAHNKQDGSFLSLHFHPRLKHLASVPLTVSVEVTVERQGLKHSQALQISFEKQLDSDSIDG
jgi:hypothetical protein